MLAFIMFSTLAADYNFDYDKGRCVNWKGDEGYNSQVFGECGNIEYLEPHWDFTQATLLGTRFFGVDVQGKVLVGTYAPYSQWFGCNLEGADASVANFIDASFHNSDLKGANLAHGDLSGISGSSTLFSGADFQSSRVRAGRFMRSNFVMANFNDAQLYLTEFLESDLRGADFTHARLRGADFSGSNLQGAIFIGADLSNAWYDRCTKLPFNKREARKKGMRSKERPPTRPCSESKF